MAGQSHFAAATKSGAVDRRDHRLATGLQPVKSLREIGALHRLAEFGNIGTGKKCPSITADDDGLDSVVGQRFVNAVDQSLTNG